MKRRKTSFPINLKLLEIAWRCLKVPDTWPPNLHHTVHKRSKSINDKLGFPFACKRSDFRTKRLENQATWKPSDLRTKRLEKTKRTDWKLCRPARGSERLSRRPKKLSAEKWKKTPTFFLNLIPFRGIDFWVKDSIPICLRFSAFAGFGCLSLFATSSKCSRWVTCFSRCPAHHRRTPIRKSWSAWVANANPARTMWPTSFKSSEFYLSKIFEIFLRKKNEKLTFEREFSSEWHLLRSVTNCY